MKLSNVGQYSKFLTAIVGQGLTYAIIYTIRVITGLPSLLLLHLHSG